MNRLGIAVSRGAGRGILLALGLIGLSAASLPAQADDGNIVATVNVPAQGLSCEDAADQASVTFKALNIPFQVTRLSVFIDGSGLPESAVDQAWPTLVVRQGLHPGRNLVELILYGADNQSMDRKQSVLIGSTPLDSDVAPAQIDCNGAVAAEDETPQTSVAVNESADANVDAAPPAEPVYDDLDGPAYNYYPVPVFFGPVIPFAYFAAPTVIYAAPPPLFFYHRGGYYGRPGYNGGNHNDWHDGNAAGRPHDNGPPAAHHGTFSTYAPPQYAPRGEPRPIDDAPGRPSSAQINRNPRAGVAQPRFNGAPPATAPRPLPMPAHTNGPPPRPMPPPSQRSGPPPQAQHGGAPQQRPR